MKTDRRESVFVSGGSQIESPRPTELRNEGKSTPILRLKVDPETQVVSSGATLANRFEALSSTSRNNEHDGSSSNSSSNNENEVVTRTWYDGENRQQCTERRHNNTNTLIEKTVIEYDHENRIIQEWREIHRERENIRFIEKNGTDNREEAPRLWTNINETDSEGVRTRRFSERNDHYEKRDTLVTHPDGTQRCCVSFKSESEEWEESWERTEDGNGNGSKSGVNSEKQKWGEKWEETVVPNGIRRKVTKWQSDPQGSGTSSYSKCCSEGQEGWQITKKHDSNYDLNLEESWTSCTYTSDKSETIHELNSKKIIKTALKRNTDDDTEEGKNDIQEQSICSDDQKVVIISSSKDSWFHRGENDRHGRKSSVKRNGDIVEEKWRNQNGEFESDISTTHSDGSSSGSKQGHRGRTSWREEWAKDSAGKFTKLVKSWDEENEHSEVTSWGESSETLSGSDMTKCWRNTNGEHSGSSTFEQTESFVWGDKVVEKSGSSWTESDSGPLTLDSYTSRHGNHGDETWAHHTGYNHESGKWEERWQNGSTYKRASKSGWNRAGDSWSEDWSEDFDEDKNKIRTEALKKGVCSATGDSWCETWTEEGLSYKYAKKEGKNQGESWTEEWEEDLREDGSGEKWCKKWSTKNGCKSSGKLWGDRWTSSGGHRWGEQWDGADIDKWSYPTSGRPLGC